METKNKNSIQTIIFDLGNVLIKIDYTRFLKNLSLDGRYNEKEIYNLLVEPTSLYEKGIIDSRTFYEKAINKISINVDYEYFYNAWCSVASEVVEGMEEIVEKLNNVYPLYLLSNTNEAHLEYILDKFRILKYFREMFLSYKIGSMKPEQKIYKVMLEKLNVNPKEILYIDDKLENLEAAKEFGIISYKFINSLELNKYLKFIKLMEY